MKIVISHFTNTFRTLPIATVQNEICTKNARYVIIVKNNIVVNYESTLIQLFNIHHDSKCKVTVLTATLNEKPSLQ